MLETHQFIIRTELLLLHFIVSLVFEAIYPSVATHWIFFQFDKWISINVNLSFTCFSRIISNSNKWWAWPPRREPPIPPWPPRLPPQSNLCGRVLLLRLPPSVSNPRPPISCPSVQLLHPLLLQKLGRKAETFSSRQNPATAGSMGPGSSPSKTTLPRACPTSRALSGKARVHREPPVRALNSHHSSSLSNSSTCSNPLWANR